MVRQGGCEREQKTSINPSPPSLTSHSFRIRRALEIFRQRPFLPAYKAFPVLIDVAAPLDPETPYVLHWCATVDHCTTHKSVG